MIIPMDDKSRDNWTFVNESEEKAKAHEWLYHCTNITAAKSIIKNREMWLSALDHLNDREEAKQVDVKEYTRQTFVGSFTWNPNISKEHWSEYAGVDFKSGVLIGFKRDWFQKSAVFIKDGQHHPEHHIGTKKLSENESWFSEKWRIWHFNFCEICYEKTPDEEQDDQDVKFEKRKIKNPNGDGGSILIPAVAGIVKQEKGDSDRSGEERKWAEENEVRLKVILYRNPNSEGVEFSQIAVPLTSDAFDELVLEFSPAFPEEDKNDFLKQVHDLLLESPIVNSKGQKYSICDE